MKNFSDERKLMLRQYAARKFSRNPGLIGSKRCNLIRVAVIVRRITAAQTVDAVDAGRITEKQPPPSVVVPAFCIRMFAWDAQVCGDLLNDRLRFTAIREPGMRRRDAVPHLSSNRSHGNHGRTTTSQRRQTKVRREGEGTRQF